MVDYVNLRDMLPAILDSINAGGSVSFTATGNSMRPMLHHCEDTVTLIKPEFPLKKYDLPLYRRPDGAFIIHRIIKSHDGVYDMRGDNCDYTEPGIPESSIIALVTGFERRGKKYSTNDFCYKLYCVLWCNNFAYFFRKVIPRYVRAARNKLLRPVKKLINKA